MTSDNIIFYVYVYMICKQILSYDLGLISHLFSCGTKFEWMLVSNGFYLLLPRFIFVTESLFSINVTLMQGLYFVSSKFLKIYLCLNML